MIQPTPAPSFRWQHTHAGAALVCEPLEPFAAHFFTTRSWKLGSRSVSTTHSVSTTDSAEVTEADRWAEVASVMDTAAVARLRQVHGRGVVIASQANGPIADGDILMSGEAGRTLAVQAADCVPLLFVDPGTGAIAAAHAGWRGMVARVPQVAVAALGREFGCRPDDLIVAAGPSIGACCYEVGTDVREAFIGSGFAHQDIDSWFHAAPVSLIGNPSIALPPARPDHWFFDGWACVRRQLEAVGVPPDRIHGAGLCTASHPDVFPSYRRDGRRAGRIVGAIKGGEARQGGSDW